MYYSIRHLTKFAYKTAVSESIMETRMHPRSDAQPALPDISSFGEPALSRVQLSRPSCEHTSTHFDIPGQHGQLVIVAESLVEMQPHTMVPESLPNDAWGELDRLVHEGDFWEMMLPSEFVTSDSGVGSARRPL